MSLIHRFNLFLFIFFQFFVVAQAQTFTKEDTAQLKKICSIVVSSYQIARNDCLIAADPKYCLKGKRKLITETFAQTFGINSMQFFGVVTMCEQLKYPLNSFEWFD